jgi:hypothetical protein
MCWSSGFLAISLRHSPIGQPSLLKGPSQYDARPQRLRCGQGTDPCAGRCRLSTSRRADGADKTLKCYPTSSRIIIRAPGRVCSICGGAGCKNPAFYEPSC